MWTCPNCSGETEDGFNVCWTCRAPRNGVSPDQEVLMRVLVTTTPRLDTHRIDRYLGPVFGETILGTSVVRDMFAAITDLAGGRSSAYEAILNQGRTIAVREMAERVEQAGGNAAVGVSITYESLDNNMLMICATGTAVQAIPVVDR